MTATDSVSSLRALQGDKMYADAGLVLDIPALSSLNRSGNLSAAELPVHMATLTQTLFEAWSMVGW